jgi:hypothetical protein
MINSNKIHFITAPLGQYTAWSLDNVENLFSFNNNNKIFFKFGSKARLDISTSVPRYTRISLVTNDHISNFHNINFVYYGWELITCLDELYRDFPGSEFSLSINNLEDPRLEKLDVRNLKKYNDLDFLITTYEQHRTIIRNFLEGKTYTSKIREKKSADGSIEKSITTYYLTN